MSERIRMNFPAMEALAKAFQDGIKDMEEIEAKIKELAGSVENGALQGKAGTRLQEMLSADLAGWLATDRQRLDEFLKDIREAIHQMQNADQTAGDFYRK